MQESNQKQLGKIQNLKNKTKKMVARAMIDEAEKEIENLRRNSNDIFKLVKSMQKNGKDAKSGRCIRDEKGRLGLSITD